MISCLWNSANQVLRSSNYELRSLEETRLQSPRAQLGFAWQTMAVIANRITLAMSLYLRSSRDRKLPLCESGYCSFHCLSQTSPKAPYRVSSLWQGHSWPLPSSHLDPTSLRSLQFLPTSWQRHRTCDPHPLCSLEHRVATLCPSAPCTIWVPCHLGIYLAAHASLTA